MAALVQHAEHRPAVGGHHRRPEHKAELSEPGNAAAFAMYIEQGYFSLVALNFIDTNRWTTASPRTCSRNPHYHIIQVVPYGIGPTGRAVPT